MTADRLQLTVIIGGGRAGRIAGAAAFIKFADTAADVYAPTGKPAVLAAAIRAAQLIPHPS